jgi:hypothetical protein
MQDELGRIKFVQYDFEGRARILICLKFLASHVVQVQSNQANEKFTISTLNQKSKSVSQVMNRINRLRALLN